MAASINHHISKQVNLYIIFYLHTKLNLDVLYFDVSLYTVQTDMYHFIL